jgi:hypothetical protein
MSTMRICGPYVLAFRMHTIEAYSLPTHISSEVGDFTPTHMRIPPNDLSTPTKNTYIKCDNESEIYGLSVLADDSIHGIFHFYVKLTVRPSPSLSVSLLGVRPTTITSPHRNCLGDFLHPPASPALVKL